MTWPHLCLQLVLMEPLALKAVPYFDNKRTLHLYDCQAFDHLAVQEWLDRHLRGDYLFKKNHLLSIIKRETSKLYAILLDGMYCGTVVYYNGSILHNIMIDPDFRGLGIGESVIRFLNPSIIRAKTNMQAGDPVPFYKKLGFEPVSQDPERPHIVVMQPAGASAAMVRPQDAGALPAVPPVASFPRLAVPPEADPVESDAAKWRALKQRQRDRQAKRKAEAAAADAAHAAIHFPPVVPASPPFNQSILSPYHENGLVVHSE